MTSAELSFEVESSRASSEGLRASSSGRKPTVETENGQSHRGSGQSQNAGWQGLKASTRGLGGYSEGTTAHRQTNSSSDSDLDISCLVDNTPFKINEVCHTLSVLSVVTKVVCLTQYMCFRCAAPVVTHRHVPTRTVQMHSVQGSEVQPAWALTAYAAATLGRTQDASDVSLVTHLLFLGDA